MVVIYLGDDSNWGRSVICGVRNGWRLILVITSKINRLLSRYISSLPTKFHLPMLTSFIEYQWTDKQTNRQTRGPLGKGESRTGQSTL